MRLFLRHSRDDNCARILGDGWLVGARGEIKRMRMRRPPLEISAIPGIEEQPLFSPSIVATVLGVFVLPLLPIKENDVRRKKDERRPSSAATTPVRSSNGSRFCQLHRGPNTKDKKRHGTFREIAHKETSDSARRILVAIRCCPRDMHDVP